MTLSTFLLTRAVLLALARRLERRTAPASPER